MDKGASRGEQRDRVSRDHRRIYAEMKKVDISKEIFLGVIKSIVDNIVDSDISGRFALDGYPTSLAHYAHGQRCSPENQGASGENNLTFGEK